MALKRGDKISSYEGVDFAGNKYAIVLDFDPAEDGKAFLSLYFPESKSARKYKVSTESNAAVVPTSYDEKGDSEDGYVIPSSEVDNLRAKSPGSMDMKPNRSFQPDSYFPEDPNYPSTMTDVLWRPELRWTPFPRFYNTRRRRSMFTRRRRFAAGEETVGSYFRAKFGQLLAGFDDGDLENVPLDTYVGERCRTLMDRTASILKIFRLELVPGEARQYSKCLIEGTVAVMQTWYYG